MELAETILPCPCCGSRRTSIEVQAEDFTVICESCGAVGPEDHVEEFAVQRWNSRSALAAIFLSASR